MSEIITTNVAEETTDEVIERIYDVDGKLVCIIAGSLVVLVGAVWAEKKFGLFRKGLRKLKKIFHIGGKKKVVVVQTEDEAEAVVNGEIDIEELD